MAELMRRHDWAATALGPPEAWPESLKLALRILLTSRFDMWMGWGPDIHFFYNDAYRPTLGMKHATALGRPMREVWAEVWDAVRDRVQTVYEQGLSTWDRDLLLILERAGYPEETYHTFSYSPLLDDQGQVAGLFCAVAEETERVVSERRLASLRELAAALNGVDDREDLFRAVATALGGNPHDLPFTLTYVFDQSEVAHLACTSGIERDHPYARQIVGLEARGEWQLERILEGESLELAIPPQAVALPCGAWQRPPRKVALIPIAGQGAGRPLGFLVVALNPFRPHDTDYPGFIGLLAGQIASTLASVDAYQAERLRAQTLTEIVRMRKQAAEALRRANAGLIAEVEQRTAERDHLHRLFQQAPSFICVLRGPEHVFELTNDAYLDLVGHPIQIGQTVREALPEIAGQGFFERLDEVYRSGQVYVGRNVPIVLTRQPGGMPETRYLHFIYQPILDADGSVSGIFVEGNDLTEQINAEAALKRLNETLEAKVAERTDALALALRDLKREAAEREVVQEALRQAQKMEAVGQLTGGIAHDFNNLLTGILGSLDLMQRRIETGRGQDLERYIEVATGAANRAAALTNRLLAFSRRQPLAPRPVDANQLVASIQDLLLRSIGETIALEFHTARDLWQTRCDSNQLESALLNLAINARDAMPDGGRLVIETRNAPLREPLNSGGQQLPAGHYVCISVVDSGTGMPRDVLERAFEPFYTTKPMGQGTGLGLSMVYGFARQSEGGATIDSNPGKGTRVSLYLPRYLGPAPTPTPPSGNGLPDEQASGDVVLVVEDEPAVRELVVEVLHDLGCSTLEAVDGPSGLRIVESSQPLDLLITDIGLPGLDGRRLVERTRALRPDLRILFMTGYAENATSASGFLEDGMDLLTKPFGLEDLAQKIRELLGYATAEALEPSEP
ncbi:response regulator [Pseudomonas mangiferae]|uniref:histidine kinase n=2 Tax=Pseudomonas mangiferae TaxID=2593654 RepID=A0A553H539_9PSED|nr:response regulator [Pseudomonas mangiferae]